MERTVQDLFNSNLLKHQKDLSGVINKTVIFGSLIFLLLRTLNIFLLYEFHI